MRIHSTRSTTAWVSMLAVFALAPALGMAQDRANLDEQLIALSKPSDSTQVKRLQARRTARPGDDHRVALTRFKSVRFRGNPLPPNRAGAVQRIPRSNRPQELTAASAAILLGPVIQAADQPAERSHEAPGTDEGPWSWNSGDEPVSSVSYNEKKRLAIPERFGAGPECYAAAYQEAVPPEPFLYPGAPAKLCFTCQKGKKGRICFEAPSDAHRTYQFVEKLAVVPIFRYREPRAAVLFSAASFYGGSGWSRSITLWVYREECRQFVNILPEIRISNQGEFKVLTDRKGKLDGFLAVATVFSEGEGHQSPHKYEIQLFQYDRKKGRFQPVPTAVFVTEQKYGRFDAKQPTEAIDDNMEKIRQVLKQTFNGRKQ